ncbi:MAG: hypothetical protein V3V08_10005 [Nannocystaceae bacterium]
MVQSSRYPPVVVVACPVQDCPFVVRGRGMMCTLHWATIDPPRQRVLEAYSREARRLGATFEASRWEEARARAIETATAQRPGAALRALAPKRRSS